MANRTPACPQCRAAAGEHHKLSCSEPGGRKGTGPIRPFEGAVQSSTPVGYTGAMNPTAAQRFATALNKLYLGRANGTIDAESALLMEAALWEAARNGGFDGELEAELAK